MSISSSDKNFKKEYFTESRELLDAMDNVIFWLLRKIIKMRIQ